MENENKEQGKEMEIDTWNEEQFYTENIIPKIREIAELCEQRNIPYLLHVHYSHDGKNTGIGIKCECFGRNSIQTTKIGACGVILNKGIDPLGVAILGSVAMVAMKEK